MENKSHRSVHKKKGRLIAAIIAAVVVIAAIVCVAVVSAYKATTIADNIYVHSLNLGGLTVDEAVAALENKFGTDYFDKNVNVSYEGKEYEVNLLGMVELDAKETASEALGRSNNLLDRLFNKEKSVVPFELNADEDKLERALSGLVAETETEQGVFTFNEDYTSVEVDATKIDKIFDAEKTAEIIIVNAENNIFDNVEAAVMGKNNDDFVDELFGRLNRTAVNASVGMNDDGSTYIIPEQLGVKADEDVFENLYKKHNGVFKMDIKPIQPEITTFQLDIEFYQDVLGEYTSAYNAGLVNRTKNVSLAAKLVNGTVIMPGHRFSYNGVVGKRTYERGFVDATVFTGEGTEEGIGGGICQVSSTIYCAQLRADLKTVSRTNHSYTVVYVPLGQDATVVYGALDYIFENNTNYPIKILANANGGYLTVKIMGTKTDKSVTVDIVSVTEANIARGEVQKETPDLPVGTTKVKQNGQNGARVSTYKVYYKNGIEQKREFIAKSVYKPMNKIVLVGTGEVVNSDVVETPGVIEIPQDTEVFGESGITVNPEAAGSPVTQPSDESLESGESTDMSVGDEVTEPSAGDEASVVPPSEELPQVDETPEIPAAESSSESSSDLSDSGL